MSVQDFINLNYINKSKMIKISRIRNLILKNLILLKVKKNHLINKLKRIKQIQKYNSDNLTA
jgi:hypothetical protein